MRSFGAAETQFRGVEANYLGMSAELLACADLMRKGLSTFRAVGSNSPYDLVVANSDGQLWRIQVKKGRRLPPTMAQRERLAYMTSTYKVPAGTDVIALAVLADPMEVGYFQPQKSGVFYRDQLWRFWEESRHV
jgi:hypothetical protein